MAISTSDTRKGGWTSDEEKYALALVAAFQGGLLLEEPQNSLREFIAQQLGCNAMRVSKKKVCMPNGKLTYPQLYQRSIEEKMYAQAFLGRLRRAFLISVGRPVHKRKAAAGPPPPPPCPRASSPPLLAPGLLMLSLRRLFPLRACDDNKESEQYTLDAFTFVDEPLFSKRRDHIYVELRPSARCTGCAARRGLLHWEAVDCATKQMTRGGCHAFVHAPENPAHTRGWGVSMITFALCRTLRRLMESGGVSRLTRLWVAVHPCQEAPAGGSVSPTPLLPLHAYSHLPRLW